MEDIDPCDDSLLATTIEKVSRKLIGYVTDLFGIRLDVETRARRDTVADFSDVGNKVKD